jgi:Leucine-rich repeat (LRR) protein
MDKTIKLHTLTIIMLTLIACQQHKKVLSEVKVNLRGHRLTSIPDSVLQNNRITHLNLGTKSNELVLYPPLSNIKDTNTNELTNLPEQIGSLTNLKTLILNSNKLSSLPISITKLKNLEVLDLAANEQLSIIDELDKLQQLSKLDTLDISFMPLRNKDITLIKARLSKHVHLIYTNWEDFRK